MTSTASSQRRLHDRFAQADLDFVFSPRVRLALTAIVALSVPLAGVGGLFVHSERAFLIAWPLAGSSLVVSLWALMIAWQRTPSPFREFWRWWLSGSAFATILGLSLLVDSLLSGSTHDNIALTLSGYSLAICATALWVVAVIWQLRSNAGPRAISVDLLDWLIALLAVTAPGSVVVIQRVLDSGEAWFAGPVALAACILTASLLPAAVVFTRLPPGKRFVEGMFVVLTCTSVLNAWLLVANALSGFTMNAVPLLMVQATNMGMMLALPLYSHRDVSLDDERPVARHRVRRRGSELIFIIGTVPVMAVEILALPEARGWLVPLWMSVLGLLLCLVSLRYFLALGETRRLFLELEHLADERHQLLSSLMHAVDDDSERVAALLHEEAVSALVTLGSVVRASSSALDPSAAALVDGALSKVRSDLTARVDSLRRLMLAVRSPEVDEQSFVTALRVFCSELFGERGSPTVSIDVDPELVFDWTTRTILYRIAREAIRNAWRQSGASVIEVRVSWRDGSIALEITDDARAPESSSVVHEAAVAAMRLFAQLGGGTLSVERRDGHTHVVALLDVDAAANIEPPPDRGGLRLVVNETAEAEGDD